MILRNTCSYLVFTFAFSLINFKTCETLKGINEESKHNVSYDDHPTQPTYKTRNINSNNQRNIMNIKTTKEIIGKEEMEGRGERKKEAAVANMPKSRNRTTDFFEKGEINAKNSIIQTSIMLDTDLKRGETSVEVEIDVSTEKPNKIINKFSKKIYDSEELHKPIIIKWFAAKNSKIATLPRTSVRRSNTEIEIDLNLEKTIKLLNKFTKVGMHDRTGKPHVKPTTLLTHSSLSNKRIKNNNNKSNYDKISHSLNKDMKEKLITLKAPYLLKTFDMLKNFGLLDNEENLWAIETYEVKPGTTETPAVQERNTGSEEPVEKMDNLPADKIKSEIQGSAKIQTKELQGTKYKVKKNKQTDDDSNEDIINTNESTESEDVVYSLEDETGGTLRVHL